jgi:heat shock protein HslJ
MRRFALLVVLAGLLSACSLVPGASGISLDGTWQLLSGTNQGQPIPTIEGAAPTLHIDGSTIGGSSGCNIYGGTIEIHGSTVTISVGSMTEMACDEPRMALEGAFLAALPRVTTATRTGDALTLSGPEVNLQFSLVPVVPDAQLIGPVWVLNSLIDGQVASSVLGEATLQFGTNGLFSGSTGCRSFGGQFSVSGDGVQVSDLVTTKNMCTTDLVAQDMRVLEIIGGGFSFAIAGNGLTISSGQRGLAYVVGHLPD